MMARRAAGQAAKRGLRVLIVAVIAVMIGLVVFNKDPHLSEWAYRLRVYQETGL